MNEEINLIKKLLKYSLIRKNPNISKSELKLILEKAESEATKNSSNIKNRLY